MIYGHGDDIHNYGDRIKYNFSTNVRQDLDLTLLYEYLRNKIGLISSYPEPLAESLVSRISSFYKIAPENILITNGTTEAIYLIAQLFSGKSSQICIPTFSEYESACSLSGHIISFVNRDEFLSMESFRNNLVWICNPNNPTGESISKNEIKLIAEGNPDSHIIIDEAYSEFTLKNNSLLEYIPLYKNLIILKSLTKTFCIPGLRLGFIAADAAIINALKKIKQPWSVNSLAIEAGKFIYDNLSLISKPVGPLIEETHRFSAILENKFLCKITPSETTFFTVQLPHGTASDLKNYLIDNHNILIRDASNFTGLGDRHIRLAALSYEKDNIFIQALEEWKCK